MPTSSRTRSLPASAALVAALLVSVGCGGLRLQLIDASVRRPSNVAMYFTVEKTNGEPVANLKPEDFRIYEDGQPVSLLESRQTILQQEVAAVHYTLLLVDMSGSIVGSGDLPAVVESASAFAERLAPYQKVALYTFDGSPHVRPVVGFGGNVRAAVSSLLSYRPRDPSTNLNGAVVEAVRILAHQMDSAPQPLRFGTLVVFTDGTDRAHRVSGDEVRKLLDVAQFDTFAIGVGSEIDDRELRAIGRSATFASRDRADVARGFEEIGRRIEAASKKFYLLSYCSPSRAGEHALEVEAHADGRRGRLRHRFNANGFGPNCDPAQRPAFDVRHPRIRSADPRAAEAEPAGNDRDARVGFDRSGGAPARASRPGPTSSTGPIMHRPPPEPAAGRTPSRPARPPSSSKPGAPVFQMRR